MAIGDNYITAQELKDYMGLQGTQFDARVAAVCSAVSREVEDWCHRQFNDAGVATARIFRPNDRYVLVVDDFSTAAGLVIKTDNDDDGVFETTWTAADYELFPLNGVMNARTGWPFWQIKAVGYANRFHSTHRSNAQVTAQWGWTAVPPEVKEACFMLGADTFQLKDTRLGVAGSDQFGMVVRVRDSVMAQAKLRHFARQKVFVA